VADIAEAKCECGHALKDHFWKLTVEPVPKGHCTVTDCGCVEFRGTEVLLPTPTLPADEAGQPDLS
jgi:hypothetical protein